MTRAKSWMEDRRRFLLPRSSQSVDSKGLQKGASPEDFEELNSNHTGTRASLFP